MNRLSDVRTSEARLSTMRKELERRGEEADAQREELAQAAQRMATQQRRSSGVPSAKERFLKPIFSAC